MGIGVNAPDVSDLLYIFFCLPDTFHIYLLLYIVVSINNSAYLARDLPLTPDSSRMQVPAIFFELMEQEVEEWERKEWRERR